MQVDEFLYIISINSYDYYRFPGGSDGKEFACNAGDLGLIPGSGRSSEEGNGFQSSILAWRIPWTEEPGRLQFIGSQATTDQLTPSLWASEVVQVVKNPPADAGDKRDAGCISGSGRCPGGGQATHSSVSCLANPMDRGVWWTTVHGVAKSQT